MCNELLNIGVKMEEEDKSLLLLCSLPSFYDPLVTTLLYDKETLEYEDMVSMLRSNKQREKLTKEGAPQESFAMEERSGRGRKRGKSRGWLKSRKSRSKKEARATSTTRSGTSNEIAHSGRTRREIREDLMC